MNAGSFMTQMSPKNVITVSKNVLEYILVTNGEGFIITAGGMGVLEVELFSLKQGMWSIGPKLPHELDRAAGFQMGSHLLIIGGYHMGICPIHSTECFSSKYIYELINNMTDWKRREYTMTISRGHHVVIGIPSSIVKNGCSKLCLNCPGSYMYCHSLIFLLAYLFLKTTEFF